jgi:hypothetical protein
MNTRPPRILWLTAGLALATTLVAAAADLVTTFDTDAADWRASDPAAVLTWQASGGNPDGHLRATGPGATWKLLSPTAWAGDWSAYRTMRFDFALPSGHYPAAETAGMVVIAGANGETMTWTGPTPLWTWTFYEVSLDPISFGVTPEAFAAIMAAVSEVRILAEFVAGTETVALDNVVISTAPPATFTTDLRSTFSGGVTDGWSIVDDATLGTHNDGRPSWSLLGNDKVIGQYFKFASPVAWAGDWRGFTEIRYDMKWTTTSSAAPTGPLLTLFGAGGDVLTWNGTLVRDAWARYTVPLTAEAFGVDAAIFAKVLSHVSKIWIHGEFGSGDDITWVDNVTVASGPHTPAVRTTSLVSRFGAGTEGWVGYDNISWEWDATGGFLDSGGLKGIDGGGGTARFQSPDAWAGDWRAFRVLRFMVYQATASDFNAAVWIANYNGQTLTQSLVPPLRLWSPFTVDLTPAAFGVDQAAFDAVMADVACVWINSDLDTGDDTTWLDEVSLGTSDVPAIAPPDRTATFDTGTEGWTRGNFASDIWAAPAAVHNYFSDVGNPPGCIANSDGGTGTTTWYSPESWAGDWRGYHSLAFDTRILTGSLTNLITPPVGVLWLCSPHGNLVAQATEAPSTSGWKRYSFSLTPATFGVTQEEFDRIARSVAMVSIRSEWLSGTAESEGLDNVLASAAPDPYWAWLAGYLSPAELANPALSAPSVDYDHDGCGNWVEFLALTSPVDGSQRFALGAPLQDPAGWLLRFPTRNGRIYQLHGSFNLVDPGAWVPLGAPITGDETIHEVIDPAVSAWRFYRLEVGLAP